MSRTLNIHRGDAEARRFDEISDAVIGAGIEELLPVHEAQLLTYLQLSNLPVGLLINCHVPILKHGLKRIVNGFPGFSASPRLRGSINV